MSPYSKNEVKCAANIKEKNVHEKTLLPYPPPIFKVAPYTATISSRVAAGKPSIHNDNVQYAHCPSNVNG